MSAFSARPRLTKPDGDLCGCQGSLRTAEIVFELLGFAAAFARVERDIAGDVAGVLILMQRGVKR